jgi:heme-degrading monooxygenase HmoA
MVERVWSARASSPDGAAAYAEYFRRVVMPELAAVPGYRGARLLQRRLAGAIEIVVATEWDSLDVIRGFAGDDLERAVVHDEAAALFIDYDRTVRHFDVVCDDPAGRS